MRKIITPMIIATLGAAVGLAAILRWCADLGAPPGSLATGSVFAASLVTCMAICTLQVQKLERKDR